MDGDHEYLYYKLSKPFNARYRGIAVQGFYDYLTFQQSLFNHDQTTYYARFCPVIQSSGTGKSRMMTEVMAFILPGHDTAVDQVKQLYKKDVVVLYMNVRERGDVLSFPTRDKVPAEILTSFPWMQSDYEIICYAFFISLFGVLEERLSNAYNTQTSQAKEVVLDWVRQMCDMSYPPKTTTRSDFFDKIKKKYDMIHPKLEQVSEAENPVFSRRHQIARERERKNLPLLEHDSDDEPWNILYSVYERVGTILNSIFPGDPNAPKFVIAIDEAHRFPQLINTYRPADVFCRIIKEFSHKNPTYPIWVVFVSTDPKIANILPPNQSYNFDRRVITRNYLFQPYTYLGWDQSTAELGDVAVEDISMFRHIICYGRPLWHSFRTSHIPPELWNTAAWKLRRGDIFDPDNTEHVLAVLGQRFHLDVVVGHPSALAYLERGVAGHMRICLETTMDREWIFTSYPSEPLLSCVAATILHVEPETLPSAMERLLREVNRGMIDVGGCGDLASRLIWLLAKDLYVRSSHNQIARYKPFTLDDHLPDCAMIPVVEWLEFVFGPQMWDSLENETDTSTSVVRKMFENAYLNFSHWVCMDAAIYNYKDDDKLDFDDFTLRHWKRTSAAQCCPQEYLVSKVIPMYFKGGPEDASTRSRMSQIFISDVACESKDSKHILERIARRGQYLGENIDSHPYIVILADLGRAPSFSVGFSGRDAEDRCLRIYAAGVDTTPYAFLAKHGRLTTTLQNLVRKVCMAKISWSEYLGAQMKPGLTPNPEHMNWGHSETAVPDGIQGWE